MRHIRYSATAALAALALAAACKKAPAPPPPAETQPAAPAPAPEAKVSEIQVGRALGPYKRVLSPLATFGPKDTIFASVVTENVPAGAKLAAKWTFQTGQIVDTTTQAVAAASRKWRWPEKRKHESGSAHRRRLSCGTKPLARARLDSAS